MRELHCFDAIRYCPSLYPPPPEAILPDTRLHVPYATHACIRRGAPIEAGTILVLLATLVGVNCLPGVGLVCLVVPAQYYFGWRIIKNKVANNPNLNERFSIYQEVLPAMKLVKYYAWERFFEKHISDVRAREQRLMFQNAVIKTINITMVFGVPPVVSFLVLTPYEYTNQPDRPTAPFITPQVAFTMLSLFNIMRFPLVVLPKVRARGFRKQLYTYTQCTYLLPPLACLPSLAVRITAVEAAHDPSLMQ